MTVTEAIRSRRAIKGYDRDFVMPEADLRRLFELTALSPSSFNLQHWRFAAVTDPAVKEALCEAAWNQRHIRDASLVVVVAGDPSAPDRAADYWHAAPADVRDKLVPMIQAFYQDAGFRRDEAIRSGALASMTLMLAAQEMGYATCPMIGFDHARLAEIVALPEGWVPIMLITVGRGNRPPHPRSGQMRLHELVFRDRFGGPSLFAAEAAEPRP
ncbi:MAG: nitroreductase family protein [Puniceicoccaceae bacterium]|nr:MAG: nitroreductase family protein [Puniceicoccaceae bacterium]